MFCSETISRGMSRNSGLFLSNPSDQGSFKHVSAEREFLKSKESIGSDFFQNQNQYRQNNQPSSELARYRSAPSSFLGALLDTSTTDNSSGGNESEAFFSALIDGPRDLNQKSSHNQMQYSMKQEVGPTYKKSRRLQAGSSNGQIGGYGSVGIGGGGAVVGSYSEGMESSALERLNSGNKNGSNLGRQSSSPAGILNEASSSSGGSGNLMAFSSGPSSSSRFMPGIPENGNESTGTCNCETGRLRYGNSATGREYEAGFPHDSWKEPPFSCLKRNRDSDMTIFSSFGGLENQNEETRKSSPGLVHHLSLPKAKMEGEETFLNFQQETTVPCQVRAKRGCATHPRSIAERMRRNRISEKMKKLQDLFPSMDKQMNTAEMLDMAVEYIKDLQQQVEMLTNTKAKCVCSSKPQ